MLLHYIIIIHRIWCTIIVIHFEINFINKISCKMIFRHSYLSCVKSISHHFRYCFLDPEQKLKSKALYCKTRIPWRYIVIIVSMACSIICLILSLIIHVLVVEKKNVHQKAQMVLMAVMLIGFILFTLFLINRFQNIASKNLCIILGKLCNIIIIFSVLYLLYKNTFNIKNSETQKWRMFFFRFRHVLQFSHNVLLA